MQNLAIYIHWPFCKAKCPYCDFNSHVRREIEHDRWLKAYLKAIENYSSIISASQITSIFFGGGTPSLARPQMIEAILNKIMSLKICDNSTASLSSIEITLEANPTSLEIANLRAFKEAGINRISIGVQSFNDQQLLFLGRQHKAWEAKNAIEMTAKYFSNYSFDLIYALPQQTIKQWQEELKEALVLAGPHLSLYQLTIEQGTVFAEQYIQGKFQIPDEDEAADFYEATQELMDKQGLPSYEISNHSITGFECKHNLQYWHYQDYLGIGPGAHSRISYEKAYSSSIFLRNNEPFFLKGAAEREYCKLALVDLKQPETWLKFVEDKGNGIDIVEPIDQGKALKELLIMGLRLKEGIKLELLRKYTNLTTEFQAKANELIADGLIILDKVRIMTTPKGRLLLNSIVDKLTE